MSIENSESTTTEGAPVAEDLPEEANAVGDSGKKNDRDRNTLSTGNSLHVHSFRVVDSRQDLDSMQPIKLQLYPLAHTYTANYVRVHFRHLRVYKKSRVAYRAIQVRVS